jgi:hypothetical protein
LTFFWDMTQLGGNGISVRRLTTTAVLKSAASAALVTALLSYPRLSLWLQRPQPIWYLESIVFLGTTVLWGWVFAWHSHYSQRPVFTGPFEAKSWLVASAAALGVAVSLSLWLDPVLSRSTPEDYPTTLVQWLAMTLFHLAFTQLFLVYAPFAWLIRLLKNPRIATLCTVLFGVVVLTLKIRSSPTPLPNSLFVALVILRVLLGLISVTFYLRGGILLASWWSLLIEARHLLTLGP